MAGDCDLISLNDDDTGYLIVRLDPRSLPTVLSPVSGLPDLPARAVFWNTVIDTVRQAELPVSAFAAMPARALRSDKLPMLSALRQQADWLITRFASQRQGAEARLLLETAAAVPGPDLDPEPPVGGAAAPRGGRQSERRARGRRTGQGPVRRGAPQRRRTAERALSARARLKIRG